jgi:hypothetical protein
MKFDIVTPISSREKLYLDLLLELKRGQGRVDPHGCWCDVAIGNPMMQGRHSTLCERIMAALVATDADA